MTAVELPLPDHLVQLAQDAIEDAALTRWHGHTDVYSVDGHPLDFARAAASAVIEGLAAMLAGELCCGSAPEPQCGKCGQLYGEIADMRRLADRVRNVKAMSAEDRWWVDQDQAVERYLDAAGG